MCLTDRRHSPFLFYHHSNWFSPAGLQVTRPLCVSLCSRGHPSYSQAWEAARLTDRQLAVLVSMIQMDLHKSRTTHTHTHTRTQTLSRFQCNSLWFILCMWCGMIPVALYSMKLWLCIANIRSCVTSVCAQSGRGQAIYFHQCEEGGSIQNHKPAPK